MSKWIIANKEDVELADKYWTAHGEPFNKDGWMYIVNELGGKLPLRIRAVKEGMIIDTRPEVTPKRPVHGWMGHAVGGVGTPWRLKKSYGFIETACFTCGCNFQCPQCQNWTSTYNGKEIALTPREAALLPNQEVILA